MRKITLAATVVISLGSSLSLADSPTVTTKSLSMHLANQLAVAASDTCTKQGYQVAVAVVDRSGNLLAFARDPLSGHHTIAVSQGKAYTAATFQSRTLTMQDNQQLRGAPGVLLIGGGVPIRIGGNFYGAVGVSGAPAKKVTGDVDEGCANAGIDAIREAVEFAE
ncbi:MAG: heme-binding protein [Gammaproteobacteria bacterium]|nr:heme-binding protein [Gammaproteobacteria bacterium]